MTIFWDRIPKNCHPCAGRDKVFKISIFQTFVVFKHLQTVLMNNGHVLGGAFVPHCTVPIPACAGMTIRGIIYCAILELKNAP